MKRFLFILYEMHAFLLVLYITKESALQLENHYCIVCLLLDITNKIS